MADVVVVETGGDLSDQPLARAVEAFERRDYRVAVTLCEEALEKGWCNCHPLGDGGCPHCVIGGVPTG